jgi:hypothetical protein
MTPRTPALQLTARSMANAMNRVMKEDKQIALKIVDCYNLKGKMTPSILKQAHSDAFTPTGKLNKLNKQIISRDLLMNGLSEDSSYDSIIKTIWA